MWRKMAEYVERMPSIMAFLPALCDLCGKKQDRKRACQTDQKLLYYNWLYDKEKTFVHR